MDTIISKSKSDLLKVIAIIFMVTFHTFAFQDRIKEVSYISIYNIQGNIPIEYLLSKCG